MLRVGRFAGILLFAGWLSACRDTGSVRRVNAVAAIEGELDFGEVPVGIWRDTVLRVKNTGYVPFTVLEALQVAKNPSFRIDPVEAGKVMPAEAKVVRVWFRPLSEGKHSDITRVNTDAENLPETQVQVQGVGIPAVVNFDPPLLDFDVLELTDQRTLPVRVTNPSDLTLTLSLEQPANGPFGNGATTTLPPKGTAELKVTYRPTNAGQHQAQILARPCAGCTPSRLPLQGKGVSSALEFNPSPIPFDNIPVHEVTQSKTTVTNVTWRPVQVGLVQFSDDQFKLLSPKPTQMLPKQAVRMDVEFSAKTSDIRAGNMTVGYQSFRSANAEVILDASGGWPAAAIAPVSIDFGELPVGGKVEQVVRITNIGTKGNLGLTGVSVTGDFGAFGVSSPLKATQAFPWSGGAYPTLQATGVTVAPGTDYVDVKVYFQPDAVGSFQAQVAIHTDAFFNETRIVQVTGRSRSSGPCSFRLVPAPVLDFGNVPTGWGAVLGFRFENAGTTECAVKDIRLSNDAGGNFFMPGGALTGGVVIQDDAFSAQIAFRPQSAGTFTGELEMTVNNPAQPRATLAIKGTATQTCLAAAPNFLDFGPIRYDCPTIPRSAYISNQCTNSILVEDVNIGAGTSNQFALDGGPLVPVQLNPGEGFEVKVSYARNVLGQHFSPLYVTATGEPTPFLLPLLAETNHDGRQRDVFVQGNDSQLDVLFVVSNTSTMQTFQDRLKAAMPAWISGAVSQGVDLRMGVTTTGLVPRSEACGRGALGGEAGRLFPVDGSLPRWVSGARADAASMMGQLLSVGQCHNLVQGLETMRAALSDPLMSWTDDPRTPVPNDGNKGFLRAQARLAVVLVADEDDHSGFEVDSYVQFLKSIKGPNMGHRVTAYALVPTDSACTTAGPPGPRFSGVATQSGGTVQSVCSSSYGPLLDTVSRRAVGLQHDFRLSEVPTSAADIQVGINGQRVYPPDWQFDAATNSIQFAVAPPPGQRITVSYRAACPAAP